MLQALVGKYMEWKGKKYHYLEEQIYLFPKKFNFNMTGQNISPFFAFWF